MEALITALAPAFAVGLALQALIEWLDGLVFDEVASKETDPEKKKKHKAGVIRTVSIVVGVILAFALQLKVLSLSTRLSLVWLSASARTVSTRSSSSWKKPKTIKRGGRRSRNSSNDALTYPLLANCASSRMSIQM